MCVSEVQHMTGRKTGCNLSRPVFFGFLIFRQTLQLATKKIQHLCNRNWWSGLFRLGSVRFRSFFQSSELDLRTLFDMTHHGTWPFLSVNFALLTFLLSLFTSPITMPDNDIPMHPPASSPPPNSPTLADTHGSASKQKWLLTPPEPGPSGTKRSQKGVVPVWSKKGKRPSDWHLRKEEIPAKSEATKVCSSVVFNLVLCTKPEFGPSKSHPCC